MTNELICLSKLLFQYQNVEMKFGKQKVIENMIRDYHYLTYRVSALTKNVTSHGIQGFID